MTIWKTVLPQCSRWVVKIQNISVLHESLPSSSGFICVISVISAVLDISLSLKERNKNYYRTILQISLYTKKHRKTWKAEHTAYGMVLYWVMLHGCSAPWGRIASRTGVYGVILTCILMVCQEGASGARWSWVCCLSPLLFALNPAQCFPQMLSVPGLHRQWTWHANAVWRY